MPTYGYRCTVCGHEFERFQKMTDPAVKECESCGEAVKKILYPVGIQFVGTGFHVNDYNKSAASASKSSATGTTESTGDGSGSKPAETKTESATPAAASPSTETASPAAPASETKTPAGTTSSAS